MQWNAVFVTLYDEDIHPVQLSTGHLHEKLLQQQFKPDSICCITEAIIGMLMFSTVKVRKTNFTNSSLSSSSVSPLPAHSNPSQQHLWLSTSNQLAVLSQKSST